MAEVGPMFLDPDAKPRPSQRIAVPDGSCDSHAHVVGPHSDYPLSGRRGASPPEALLVSYLHMIDALGLDRAVLVQPSAYSTDNSLLVDTIALAPERLRGIGIIDYEKSTTRQLLELRDKGIRGMRFNTRGSSATSAGNSEPVSLDMVRAVGSRLADAGLHAQLLMLVDNFEDADQQLKHLPVDVVIDHMGYPDPRNGPNGPGLRMLLRWLDAGRCWVKLSAPYRFSRQDVPYSDVAAIAQTLVKAAPERILWATDWPHSAAFPPGQHPKRTMPNDGDLLDLLAEWCPDGAMRRRILVDNPAQLYGFDSGVWKLAK